MDATGIPIETSHCRLTTPPNNGERRAGSEQGGRGQGKERATVHRQCFANEYELPSDLNAITS
jgi:hypothetical protein